MPTSIKTSSLYFEFVGKRALENVTLSIVPAKITALVGPNGAGKTTLLRCLAALETPFSGAVTINGIDTRLDPHACHPFLGYLSDSFGLYDELPVIKCLIHAAEIRSITGETQRQARDYPAARFKLLPKDCRLIRGLCAWPKQCSPRSIRII